jgi:20S proteasome subunit beta 1
MAVITEEGVTRHFIPGDKLPTFWEGKELLEQIPAEIYQAGGAVPIDVEA